MASKPDKNHKKSAPPPARKTPDRKAGPAKPAPQKPAKQAPAARNSPAKSSRSSTAPNPKASRPQRAPRPAVQARARNQRPIRQGMSLDRKLDILGIVLALVGLLTLLSLLSPINSSWTGGWVSLISRTFGLGMYIFPFGLIVAGLWLVLRNFERVPQLAVERVLGFILLYANLLTDLHFWVVTRTHQAAFALAESGRGGGYLGAVVWQGLYSALGTGGAAIALAAWLLISLAMALDVTVVELVRWIPPLVGRFQDWLAERTEAGRERSLADQGSFSEFMPVPPRQ